MFFVKSFGFTIRSIAPRHTRNSRARFLRMDFPNRLNVYACDVTMVALPRLSPMPIDIQDTTISGGTGAQGFQFLFSTPTKFSDIYEGVPEVYPGSIVQVQELLNIQLSIADQTLVDVDKNWFFHHQYVGSYQITDGNAQPTHYEGDEGYMFGTEHAIRRYSTYSITPNPDIPKLLGEQFVVDNCNFGIIQATFAFGGVSATGYTPVSNKQLVVGQNSLTRVDIADRIFERKISGVGLFLKPGVEGISLRYRVAVINEIRITGQAFPMLECQLSDCDTQFNVFISNGSGSKYKTSEACEAADTTGLPGSMNCSPQTFVCPTDSNKTYQYWTNSRQQG